MPDSINTYIEAIQAALRDSPFVHEPKISVDDRGEVWFLRGDIYFIDNTRLHFRELYIRRDEPYKKTYTYHYQKADGTLIFRYDNSPHYPDLPKAPHHKHIGEDEVISASPPDLHRVLAEIASLIET
ncbi:MAG: hypothetical protein ISS57_01530 [Anaerolineales bacterium]|nr:hypothetical protein [Chloroflexota bacterium]MBL7161258.1 hypothetical protein [Anaerolineales bacterium]